jgi:hypothetical protein
MGIQMVRHVAVAAKQRKRECSDVEAWPSSAQRDV